MRFLVDVMLGKLGRWLRMMGYDTKIASDDLSDQEVVKKAEEESRIIITRDTDIDKMKTDTRVVLLDMKGFEPQIQNVFNVLDLTPRFPEGSRCPNCNGDLQRVGEERWRCKECGQRYWKGSHWERIKEVRDSLRD